MSDCQTPGCGHAEVSHRILGCMVRDSDNGHGRVYYCPCTRYTAPTEQENKGG